MLSMPDAKRVTSLLKHRLALVLLLAVLVRLAFLLIFPDILDFDRPGNAIHGSEAYDAYARNLNETGIYGRTPGVPDAQIPPLYSYVLAIVYALFGRGYLQVGLLHTLMDALSIALLYDICHRLFRQGDDLWGVSIGAWVGTLAGLFYALYPYLVFHNLTLIDTPFWMLLLHAFTWLMILLRDRESLDRQTWLIAISGGVILGLSILARPIIPPFALLVGLWFLFRRSFWQTLIRLLPVAIVGVLVVVPWIVRNYQVFDAFVPMTTTSGANFWQGNSEWTVPVFRAGYDVQWTAPEVTAPPESREADAERFQQGIKHLQQNPDQIPELLWVKFLVHWSIEIAPRYNPQPGESFALDEAGNFYIKGGETVAGVTAANTAYDSGLMNTLGRPVHILYFGSLLLLAIAGTLLSLPQWREVSLLWFVQISMTIVYLIFHPSTRYRAPSDPLLFALSAYAVVWILAQISSRVWMKNARRSRGSV